MVFGCRCSDSGKAAHAPESKSRAAPAPRSSRCSGSAPACLVPRTATRTPGSARALLARRRKRGLASSRRPCRASDGSARGILYEQSPLATNLHRVHWVCTSLARALRAVERCPSSPTAAQSGVSVRVPCAHIRHISRTLGTLPPRPRPSQALPSVPRREVACLGPARKAMFPECSRGRHLSLLSRGRCRGADGRQTAGRRMHVQHPSRLTHVRVSTLYKNTTESGPDAAYP